MSEPARSRAIDLVRALVMVLMVLDHARDFFQGFGDPTNLETTTPALFFTRWVTHFCAPAFVLLAGAAAYLYGRKRTGAERRRFLWTRGLWLVVLELTIVRFAWIPDPTYHYVFVQVIWALGWSMLLLAPLSSLPPRAIAAIGLLIVALHNLLDPIHHEQFGDWGILWAIVHERAAFEPAGRTIWIGYPLIPWIGVMMLGFGLGELFTEAPEVRRRWLLRLGIASTILFVEVRWANVYGDPVRWSGQRDWTTTFMGFLNCEKYPPSLDYLLMTLGPILLALWAFDRFGVKSKVLETFGRVPLFFYVAHLYLLRLSSAMFAYARFGMDAFTPPPHGHAGSPGYPLPAVYAAWLVALVILYPACRWFANLKERRGASWKWLAYV